MPKEERTGKRDLTHKLWLRKEYGPFQQIDVDVLGTCPYCRGPGRFIFILEELNLQRASFFGDPRDAVREKIVNIMEDLANRLNVPGFVVGYIPSGVPHPDFPQHSDDITAAYVREVTGDNAVNRLTPDEWWAKLRALYDKHWRRSASCGSRAEEKFRGQRVRERLNGEEG